MKKKQCLKLVVLASLITMPMLFSGCATFAIGAAAATAGTVVATDSRSVETMAHDEAIEQQSYEILHKNPLLSNEKVFSVSAFSVSGNVLLVGQTENRKYLEWIIDQIKRLDYVRGVYNYVEAKPVASAAQVASDSYITSLVKGRLLFGDNIKSGRFKVVTESNAVYLMGLVTQDEANRAINEVKKINGVAKIYTVFDYIDTIDAPRRNYDDKDVNVKIVDLNNLQYLDQNTDSRVNTRAPSSQYVPKASSSDNGGAVLVEDDSLLNPAYPL